MARVIRAKRKLGLFLVPIAYLVMTLVMTYPLLFRLTAAIPGDGFDGWQNYWNLWWVKRALIDLGRHPYFTTYLDYPAGVSLFFHTLNPFNGLWSLPIQLGGGLMLAYNAVVLFSFAVGGLGAYLLARYVLRDVTRSRWPAWVAGLIFTFSPFHFAHLLGHAQVFSLEWIPFYVLYFLKTVEWQPQVDAITRRWRCAGLAALFLVLVGLCDWYYVLYLVLFTGLCVTYMVVRRRMTVHALMATAAAGAAAGLVLAPLWVPMVLEVKRATYMRPNPDHVLRLSADLLAFVTPNEMHPLWGELTRGWSERFTTTTSERMIFAGFVPLGLALYAVFRSRARGLLFWVISLLFFTLLSLGPVLHVAGQTDLPVVGTLTLPYGWINRVVPFMDISRSVSRFNVMVMLSLGVLASMGVAAALRPASKQGPRAAVAVGLLMTFAICFEFLAIPYPMSPPDTPDFYRALAQDGEDYAVLNLPMDWDRPNYLLYQTVHGKRLTSAYTSRDNPLSPVDRTPVLQDFRRPGVPHVVQGDPAEVGRSVFDAFDIRYVIVDLYQMPGEMQRRETLGVVEQVFGSQQPVYSDERLVAYQVTPDGERVPFVRLGMGWSPEELTDDKPWRSMDGVGEVVVYSPSAQDLTVGMILRSPAGGVLTAHAGDAEAVTYLLETDSPAKIDVPMRAGVGDTVLTLGFEGEGALVLHSVELN